ncbi:MAG: tRNA (cytidine(34)-2'-O)-methyltransferase, partial [Acidimicrobiales bacterium]
RRLVLLTTKAGLAYTDFCYFPADILLFGRESAGVPGKVHDAADARLVIPLKPPMRSLNVAVAAAMAAGEATRQIRVRGFC